MKYDGVLIALYILVLAVLVIKLFSMVALTIVIVLLIVMIAVQKTGLEKMIKNLESEKNTKLDEIISKIDDVSRKTENFKEDLNRQVVFVDNKIGEVKHFVETEMNSAYSELARKVLEFEERLSEVRQNMASAIGSMDERLQNMEKEEETESF